MSVSAIIANLKGKFLPSLLNLDVGLVIVLGVDHPVAHGSVDGAPGHNCYLSKLPSKTHLDSGHMALESTLKMFV